MNEELIARLMAEQGMTREQAEATLQNTNSVDMQFLNAFSQNTAPMFSQGSLMGGTEMQNPNISAQPASNLNYGAQGTAVPTQQFNNLGQPLFNPSGGMNWNNFMGGGNQNLNPPTANRPINESFSVPSVENELQTGGGLPTIDTGNQVDINPSGVGQQAQEEQSSQTSPSVMDQVGMFASQLNPYGSDLETELYSLGRSIGNISNGQGSPGNTLSLIGSAGSALFGGTRSALSGFSNSKANNRYWQWMQERRRRQQYSPTSQTQNTQADALGGITQG